jgi:ADP-heptose:LPS heptosyltransferase
MVESLRKSAGMRLSRWTFRADKDQVTPFTSAVTGARNALMILPLPQFDLHLITPVIDVMRKRFHDKHITVVTPLHSVELMHLLPQGRFIRIEDVEVTPLYLPRPSFLKRLPRSDYDLAVDLNLDFFLPSGYICKKSNARIRVGFGGKNSDLFYNFLIHASLAPGRKKPYERMAACLSMF